MKIVLASLYIAACLSGCGSSSSDLLGAKPLAATSTSGYAAKGIISGAKVYVCRIDKGVIPTDANCETGTTKEDGSYSVTLTDGWVGPVLVKVMPASGSTMFDETTGRFEPFDVSGGIRAVVATAATPAYVTPFSEMAANAAVNSGNINAAVVNQANAMVESNFGIDLSIKPVVDLKSQSTDAYSIAKQIAMIQRLAQVIQASTGSGNLKDKNGVSCSNVACGIDALKAMAPSPTLVKQSAGATLGAVFSAQVNISFPVLRADGKVQMVKMDPGDITDMQNKLAGEGMTNPSSVGASIMVSLTLDRSNARIKLEELRNKTPDVNGNVAAVLTSTSQLTPLEQAKAAVSFVRNALNRFSNASESGYLDNQRLRIQSELKNMGSLQPSVAVDRLIVIQKGIKLFDDASSIEASGLPSYVLNGKTYYFTTDGNLGEAMRRAGNYTHCRAEKAANVHEIIAVDCVSSTGYESNLMQSTASFNGISSDANNNILAGSLTTSKITLKKDVSDPTKFKYRVIPTQVAVLVDGNNPWWWQSSYTIPEQNINPINGSYNFDASTGVNTLNSSCRYVNSNAYVNGTWDDNSGSSNCKAFIGTGTISRSYSGPTITGIQVAGTMPPSGLGQIGYDQIAIALNSVGQGNHQTKYNLSGSFTAYEADINSSAPFNMSNVALQIALNQGSFITVKDTLDVNNRVSATRLQEVTLNLSLIVAGTQAVGMLTGSDLRVDKNNLYEIPTAWIFNGMVSDISSNGDGEIAKGKFKLSLLNYGKIDSTKKVGFGNDPTIAITFEGGVSAKQSTDFIKVALGFSGAYQPTSIMTYSVDLLMEIAGGFNLKGSVVGDSATNSNVTIKLKNQDGILLWCLPDKNPTLYASDQTTELGQFKNALQTSGGKAFYFIDGTFASLY